MMTLINLNGTELKKVLLETHGNPNFLLKMSITTFSGSVIAKTIIAFVSRSVLQQEPEVVHCK